MEFKIDNFLYANKLAQEVEKVIQTAEVPCTTVAGTSRAISGFSVNGVANISVLTYNAVRLPRADSTNDF